MIDIIIATLIRKKRSKERIRSHMPYIETSTSILIQTLFFVKKSPKVSPRVSVFSKGSQNHWRLLSEV